MASCRYNQWILAECGVGTEHGSLVQTFISPSICTFEYYIYDNYTYMTIMYMYMYTYMYMYMCMCMCMCMCICMYVM